jgi:hypothetical protein
MKDTTKVLIGFAAGLAAAAGLYALMRTEKGKKITADLGNKAAGLKKDLDRLVEKGRAAAGEMTDKLNGRQAENV